jgi:hypothetical protein
VKCLLEGARSLPSGRGTIRIQGFATGFYRYGLFVPGVGG